MNTNPDRSEEKSPETESPETESTAQSEGETVSTQTPLRQLLHWVTGDRDAEAKALADETLGLREAPQTADANETRPQSVLAAAKSAVSEAHGDSNVPNEFEDGPVTKESSKQPNPLTKWEDANSLSESSEDKESSTPKMDADVARPDDVKDRIDGQGKPQGSS